MEAYVIMSASIAGLCLPLLMVPMIHLYDKYRTKFQWTITGNTISELPRNSKKYTNGRTLEKFTMCSATKNKYQLSIINSTNIYKTIFQSLFQIYDTLVGVKTLYQVSRSELTLYTRVAI